MFDNRSETEDAKPMLSEWMTRAELALELHVTTETLCRWNSRRHGPVPTRIGRSVFYRRETVRQWILAQERDYSPEAERVGQRRRAQPGLHRLK
jgi:predicted DNA-binding transcriptional regulator AlpA